MNLKIFTSSVVLVFVSLQAIHGVEKGRAELGKDLTRQCTLATVIEQDISYGLQENIL